MVLRQDGPSTPNLFSAFWDPHDHVVYDTFEWPNFIPKDPQNDPKDPEGAQKDVQSSHILRPPP